MIKKYEEEFVSVYAVQQAERAAYKARESERKSSATNTPEKIVSDTNNNNNTELVQ